MRRAAVLLALSAAVAAGLPAFADTSAAVGVQDQLGSVAAPVAVVARVPRTLALTDRSTNGLTGFAFDVDPATVGGPFTLDVAGDPTGQGDLQIGFYSSLGTAADPASVAGEFINERVGGEAGFVPEGAKVALVYLNVGAQVSFDYTATPPVGLALSAASLDVTVPKGQALKWTNDTQETLTVVAVEGADGFPLFDSGELAPGASFTVPLTEAGAYAYRVGARTGTVTVTG